MAIQLGLLAGLVFLGFTASRVSRHHENWRRPIMVAYIIITLTYLLWRVIYTIPTNSAANMTAGIALLLLETIGFVQMIGFIGLFWTPANVRRGPSLTGEVPTVDVFIATYNEPTEILEKTIVAATQLDYPSNKFTIHLCDDGDRQEMRELAKKWGIGYIRRDDHREAKAGNLNNALAHTSGEIVITMDADMVMKPHFLAHTIGHFQNEKVGFVQAPQAFHNPDVFQHNLFAENVMRNDQDFFMRCIEPQRDQWNAAIYIGSGAAFRRTALEGIGGFVGDVITEDMATGLVLQNAGWQAVYVNEVLATGLSPENYAELIKQRSRWGRGNIQVAKKYGPHRLKNLSFAQKWLLLDSVHYWLFGAYQLVYWALPVVTLAFGVQLIRGNPLWFIAFWALQFLFARFVYESVSKGRFKTAWTSVYEVSQGPQVLMAVLQELFLNRSVGFQVTTKGQEITKASFDWRNAWPQIVLFTLSLAVFVLVGFRVAAQGWIFIAMWIVPIGWMTFNTLVLFAALLTAIDRPRYRQTLHTYEAAGTYAAPGAAHTWPVRIEALHSRMVCLSLPLADWERLRAFREGVVSFDHLTIPVAISRISVVGDTVYVFASITDVAKGDFAKLIALLNRLNTEIFKTRPSPDRFGLYDITIGLLVRRRVLKDKLEIASK